MMFYCILFLEIEGVGAFGAASGELLVPAKLPNLVGLDQGDRIRGETVFIIGFFQLCSDAERFSWIN
jgi:hypothetical protein